MAFFGQGSLSVCYLERKKTVGAKEFVVYFEAFFMHACTNVAVRHNHFTTSVLARINNKVVLAW